MKKALLSLFLALSISIATAQETQTDYNFLRLPVSAHAAALGGNNISLDDDDASLIFHNPALIINISDKSLDLNFMTYMSGTSTGSASFVTAVKEKAAWGVLAQYMDYGEIKETTADNIETGSFRPRDIVLGGSFAYLLKEHISGGLTVKFISSSIAGYNSLAMGVDLGVNYNDSEKGWSASVMARNLGGQLKAYDDEFEAIPLDLQAGVSRTVPGAPFRLSLTAVDLRRWDYKFIDHFCFGVDILLSENIYLAGGFNFLRNDEMVVGEDENESAHGAGLSFGAGLQLEHFKLNIGWAKYHVSSSSLLVNIGYSL